MAQTLLLRGYSPRPGPGYGPGYVADILRLRKGGQRGFRTGQIFSAAGWRQPYRVYGDLRRASLP